MAKEIYPYAVARVRMLEQKIFSMKKLDQMAEAKNAEDALRMILENSGTQGDVSVYDYEKVLSERTKEAFDTIRELLPEENMIEIFLFKNDYHNLKVLIKSQLSHMDGESYLIDGGTKEIAVLKEAVEKHDFSNLPPVMAEAVKEAFLMYAKTQKGQMIDVVLDKAYFKSMAESALLSKDKFMQEYVVKLCDISNLKSFVRVKKRKKEFEEFSFVYTPEGSISLDLFEKAFMAENPVDYFLLTAYGNLVKVYYEEGITSFEKACDNYIMDFMKQAKSIYLTAEPLAAYLYAREMETKSLRIIMTGKLNQIDTQIIKERLRDAYV